jgi:hypothetical protein
VGPSKIGGRKKWWPFGIVLFALLGSAGVSFSLNNGVTEASPSAKRAGFGPAVLRLAAAGTAQGQFATGQGIKITDGTNFLAVDPCAAQPKSYASINQTASTQLVAGTASRKIYLCSIHVVVAAATNVAVVEGTGTVCGTGAGVRSLADRGYVRAADRKSAHADARSRQCIVFSIVS